jgi:hypothetical protein
VHTLPSLPVISRITIVIQIPYQVFFHPSDILQASDSMPTKFSILALVPSLYACHVAGQQLIEDCDGQFDGDCRVAVTSALGLEVGFAKGRCILVEGARGKSVGQFNRYDAQYNDRR